MSITYWFARKFGILIALLYLGAFSTLVFSYYYSGVSDPSTLASFYPPGRAYPRTVKNRAIMEIFGLPVPEDEAVEQGATIDILSYSDEGAVVRFRNGSPVTVPANKVVRYLLNQDSSEIESYLAPLTNPVAKLVDLHLGFMKGVEASVGGQDEKSLRRFVLPKIVVSLVYLGLVFITHLVLKKVDNLSDSSYKGGYSLTYGGLAWWPAAVIATSFVGANVVDVVRHLPYSYDFMHWYVIGGWAIILAWPVLVVALSIADIVRSFARMEINHALTHTVVLAAGLAAIPLVTVGVLFAILSVMIVLALRAGKKLIMPAGSKRR